MENYPKLETLEVRDKVVIVRADLDVDIKDGSVVNPQRLENLLPTINALLDKGATRIIVIGHRGRPEGKDESLSLRELQTFFKEKVTPDVFFAQSIEDAHNMETKLVLLENLRFWPEEEANDSGFASQLASLGEVYVNDAFASSHREHASIVGIPKLLPSALGIQFQKEIENLSKVFDNPKHPVVAIIGGAKKDKLEYLEYFKEFCDKVLIGGRLPEFLGDEYTHPKVIVARLMPDKEDITIHSMEAFEEAINHAGTVVFAGPVGLYEDGAHVQGTKRVLEAIAQSGAFKVAGGGDTEAAIKTFGYEKSFDWISSGGGASLDFLVNKTLPGLTALVH
jgi:phosphoglycerate kinase